MYMYLYIPSVDDRRGHNYIGVLPAVLSHSLYIYIYINLNEILLKLNSHNLS